MLHNGHGGVDWAGLDLAVEVYAVKDVERLVQLLLAAKGHRKPADESLPGDTPATGDGE